MNVICIVSWRQKTHSDTRDLPVCSSVQAKGPRGNEGPWSPEAKTPEEGALKAHDTHLSIDQKKMGDASHAFPGSPAGPPDRPLGHFVWILFYSSAQQLYSPFFLALSFFSPVLPKLPPKYRNSFGFGGFLDPACEEMPHARYHEAPLRREVQRLAGCSSIGFLWSSESQVEYGVASADIYRGLAHESQSRQLVSGTMHLWREQRTIAHWVDAGWTWVEQNRLRASKVT